MITGSLSSRVSLPEQSASQHGLLMIAYWYPPENESGALRPYRFCKYLPQHGYWPHVVSANHDVETQGVLRTPGNAYRASSLSRLFWRAVQRLAPYNDRLEWIADGYGAAAALVLRKRIRAIVSTSPPLATHLVAMRLKKRFRLPWIADFRDPLWGNPFRTRRWGSICDQFVERLIIQKADAVIVNTDAVKRLLSEHYPECEEKIHVIWNGYDPQDELVSAPIPARSFRKIAHFGSIYGGRHPGLLLENVERMLATGALQATDFRIELVGSFDRDAPWLRSRQCAALVARGCLEFHNEVLPQAVAHEQMATADYLLLLDLNERGTGLQVPGKLFEYIRIGRPILALTTHASPVERILKRSGVPHACLYRDDGPDETCRKLAEFLVLPTVPVLPSEWFREQFDATVQTGQLAQIFTGLLSVAR